jgi:ABC-type branched-subunit amino acid transport system ATPase component
VTIDQLVIRNFKRLVDVTVDLNDITYLVGGNNSGKSSVLQAVHLAVSCAERSAELKQVVVAESSLRYCPTGEFERLGHSSPYENRSDGSRGVIEFLGKTSDDAVASYKIEIYKARNYHNVGVDRSGVYPGFGQFICDPKNMFSVYVPGLSGIPHHEEMQSYGSVFRRAAGGEANLVFRNIIRIISERGRLKELENQLLEIIGPCKFSVNFDANRDLHVDVKISFTDPFPEASFVPIDLSGTGIIQVTQILAYVILFGPKLLLVDEPDSHLHPSRQALLSVAFGKITKEYGCKVIISTHSRHLVSSASADTKIVWLRNGQVEAQGDNALVAILMDLGALDQIDSAGADILVCTEDKGKKQLQNCIMALGLPEDTRVISYNGVSNAASAAVIQTMAELLTKKPQVVVHRDRDFLTDHEMQAWGTEYRNRGCLVFSPQLPDMESYYVTAEHLSEVYGIGEEDAKAQLILIFESMHSKLRQKFMDKRRDANLKYWRDGGGPASDQMWPEASPVTTEVALGKEVLSKVNEVFGGLYGGRRNPFDLPSKRLSEELSEFFLSNRLSAAVATLNVENAATVISAEQEIT